MDNSNLSQATQRKQARSEGNGDRTWLWSRGIPDGEFYQGSKPGLRAIMRDSHWTDTARVYACVSLHTLCFGQLLGEGPGPLCAVKLNAGKVETLRPVDIERETGIDRRRVRRAGHGAGGFRARRSCAGGLFGRSAGPRRGHWNRVVFDGDCRGSPLSATRRAEGGVGSPPEAVQPPVLRTNHHPAGGYRGRSRKRGAGFEIPKLLSGGQIEHVEVAVVGTYVYPAVRYGGR